jgi:hypothetical protein
VTVAAAVLVWNLITGALPNVIVVGVPAPVGGRRLRLLRLVDGRSLL